MTTMQTQEFVQQLRGMALRGLQRMYLPDERLFVFALTRKPAGVIPEGISRRYTAITLIGLAQEEPAAVRTVLGGHELSQVCDRLKADVPTMTNLGDVALTLWAACALGDPDRQGIRDRLAALLEPERPAPTIELCWALDALCKELLAPVGPLRVRTAQRLLAAQQPATAVFPHVIGGGGLRSHIACFADMVYPIHALANYAKLAGDQRALDASAKCAERICRLQGDAGQWWWHYDRRTGGVFERYPVYAIHQDAMAPMALFALRDAGGPDFRMAVHKGLAWLHGSPEISASLVDEKADLIWRKVARRGTSKAFRAAQSLPSRIHPALRVPALDLFFPPVTVDYEDRPYHLGWLLYAWPQKRVLA